MRISRIIIKNFRNFELLDVTVGKSAVIVGENQVGKTNLIFALRLLLDPNLPDSARQLRIDDFWDGVEQPITEETRIRISVDIMEFEDNEALLAVLGENLIEPDPMIARLTYDFGMIPGRESNNNESNFEFSIYGGDRPENRIGYELRKRLARLVRCEPVDRQIARGAADGPGRGVERQSFPNPDAVRFDRPVLAASEHPD